MTYKPITLQQIAELPESEQRQAKARFNHYLGRQYLVRQMRKKIALARRRAESETDYETNC